VTTLAQALTALEDHSTADIAAVLRGAGMSGLIGDQMACPLAQYLSRETGLLTSVDNNFAYGSQQGVHLLPVSCIRFVREFDCEMFPDLCKTGPYERG